MFVIVLKKKGDHFKNYVEPSVLVFIVSTVHCSVQCTGFIPNILFVFPVKKRGIVPIFKE